MIRIEKLENIPPGDNPFLYDRYNMGTYIATNVAIMYGTFEKDKASYVVVVNRETGERVKLWFGPGNNGIWNESHPFPTIERGREI